MAGSRRTSARVRYQFDDANRLTVRERLRPVRVVDGRVTLDANNRLVYRTQDAARADDPSAPRAVAFDGDWSLTDQHGLALTLRQASGGGRQQRLYLRGALTGAQANALVFTFAQDGSAESRGQRISLSGRWQADARNRLVFLAQKADGSEDRITLQGGWELDEHHRLLYRSLRRGSARRRSREHAVVFDGAWDIPGADRLVYRLEGSSRSAFEFRAGLRSRSLMAGNGRMVYEVGIGLARSLRRQRVSLFGTWKLNRDLSVTFEVPYAGGRVQGIRFESEAALSGRDRLALGLSARGGDRLGLTVTFTRQLVPHASLFLRLQQDAEERSAMAGVQVRF